MTTRTTNCVKCDKQKALAKCVGCVREFCYIHFPDHHQELSKQLDEIEYNRNLFRQILSEQSNALKEHLLIKQINEWEDNLVINIRTTAAECRQRLLQHTTKHLNEIEIDLNQLTNRLVQVRQENDFNEIDLNQFKRLLNQLEKELDKQPTISIERDLGTFTNKISVATFSDDSSSLPHISIKTKWMQDGTDISGINKFCRPQGICIDNDSHCIYIADSGNHRIIELNYQTNNRRVVAGGNGQGENMDQLNWPTDVTVNNKEDYVIICDRGNRRLIRWSRKNGKRGYRIISDIDCYGVTTDNNGDIYVSVRDQHEILLIKWVNRTVQTIAGGNGNGRFLDQLDSPTYIFVDQDYSIFVSDSKNNRVMKWLKDAEQGIVVAGGQGQGNYLTQLSNPCGVFVNQSGDVYVADSDNDRIMLWSKGSRHGQIISRRTKAWLQQCDSPEGLVINQQGHLYVVDCGNDRIQKIANPK